MTFLADEESSEMSDLVFREFFSSRVPLCSIFFVAFLTFAILVLVRVSLCCSILFTAFSFAREAESGEKKREKEYIVPGILFGGTFHISYEM